MKAQHTPGPWKVMADPINKGRHPLHDGRWIVTNDAETETDGKAEWRLISGSLIAKVRDTERQPYDAKLLAAAPSMYDALWAIANMQITEYTDKSEVLALCMSIAEIEIERIKMGPGK